jgi:hypothetical protein
VAAMAAIPVAPLLYVHVNEHATENARYTFVSWWAECLWMLGMESIHDLGGVGKCWLARF